MVKIRCFVDTAPVLLAPEAAPLSFCYCWCQLCFRRGGKEEEKVSLLGGCFRDFGGFCSWQSVFSSSEFAHRFSSSSSRYWLYRQTHRHTHTYNTHARSHRLETLSNTLSSSMARGREGLEAERARRHKTSQKRSSETPWTTRKVSRGAIRNAPRSRFPVLDHRTDRKSTTRPRPHTPHSKINRKWQNPKITALAKLVPRNGNVPSEPETRCFLNNHAHTRHPYNRGRSSSPSKGATIERKKKTYSSFTQDGYYDFSSLASGAAAAAAFFDRSARAVR